jgi:DNA-directed RNA polymerase subunit RPC12/RpoP
MLLFAVAAGVRLVFRGADEVFAVSFALLLALGVLWILISVLMPAKADRTCPRCRRSALGRIDPQSTQGVACRHCGYRDETASAFLLAEEEGPLEDIVLRERQRRRF